MKAAAGNAEDLVVSDGGAICGGQNEEGVDGGRQTDAPKRKSTSGMTQIETLLHNKGNRKQDDQATYGEGEGICKSDA